MQQIDFSDYRNDPAVRRLLRLAAEPASEQGMQDLLDVCEALEVLAVFDDAEQIIAIAAYRHSDQYSVCLEYLAVDSTHQGLGLGRSLVEELRDAQAKSVWATTADDAVDFYRAIGCVISQSAQDPRWPGEARYLCTLPYYPLLNSQPDQDPEYEAVGGELTRGLIEIAEPSDQWPRDFELLRHTITQALGPRALAVEHTGSTSVPGLPAKPIIDLAVLVPDANAEADYVPALEHAGLVLWHREPGWYAHRMVKPPADSTFPAANIHVFSAGSPEYLRMMLFREHLTQDAKDRAAYAAVKRQAARELAASDGEDGLVMDYNRIKEPFILQLHQRLFNR